MKIGMGRPKGALKVVAIIITTIVAVSGLNYWIFNSFLQKDTSRPIAATSSEGPGWLDLPPLVAHAGGGVRRKLSNETYRDSVEAFLQNYELGHRVFEFDFYLDKDDNLIVEHGERLNPESGELPYRTDMASVKEIIQLLYEHKDAYIITDTKITYDEESILSQFEQLRDAARRVDEDILDRIIPQIYNQPMLPIVLSTYDYKDIIYTLYSSPDSNEDVIKFVMANTKIRAVTCHGDREKVGYLAPKIGEMGLRFYVHTFNTYTDFVDWAKLGVTGWYTDFLTPSDYTIWKNLEQVQ